MTQVAELWRGLRLGVHLMHERSPAWVFARVTGYLRRGDIAGLFRIARQHGAAPVRRTFDHTDWIRDNEPDVETQRAMLLGRLENVPQPLISVLMPVYNTPLDLLDAAVASVEAQIYPNWQLCIADDGSPDPRVRQFLADRAAKDLRIRVTFCPRNGGISAASNVALELVTGDWVALLDHDDLLAPGALAQIALQLEATPDAELIYTDEDKITRDGRRFQPYFKPDYSRELFRSQNYFNHLTVHRTANLRALGGWRSDFDGSQDYDLSLRIVERIEPAKIVHIPAILYHWRAVPGSTALAAGQKDYAVDAGLRALADHVRRTGLAATVEMAPGTANYRLRPALPEPPPSVTLIIPTRDGREVLETCITSIFDKTRYPDYDVLVVDNGSTEPGALDYLRHLEQRPGVRVIPYHGAFNYSAINNFAALEARGAILGLVNNDIEVIAPDWLAEMVSWAAQPDIGCVGAKLYYPDNSIQHAGVITGLGGVAGHSHKHFPADAPGYFHRLKLVQNLSAVTGACLLVRAGVYAEVGGLDAINLPVAFNDVDFCLKVRAAGYLNVWTPYAELFHHESASRGADDTDWRKRQRFRREVEYMQRRWQLTDDRYYSPHLTRDREDFSVADRPSGPPARRSSGS